MSTHIFLAVAVTFCAVTYSTLRGGWRLNGGLKIPELSFEALITAILSIGAAIYFFGPLGGIALALTVVVHEFGHVAAYRVCGHRDARFRLVPLFGGVAISDQLPATQARDFYISAMGPGICLALMITSMALEQVALEYVPALYPFFYVLTNFTAALNFFNLLPLWPLDGSRMLRPVMYAFSPVLAQYVTLAMSAAFVAFGIVTQSTLMLIFALLSAGTAFNAPVLSSVQRPLTRWQAVMCLVLHLAMVSAFGLVAMPFLSRYF